MTYLRVVEMFLMLIMKLLGERKRTIRKNSNLKFTCMNMFVVCITFAYLKDVRSMV